MDNVSGSVDRSDDWCLQGEGHEDEDDEWVTDFDDDDDSERFDLGIYAGALK